MTKHAPQKLSPWRRSATLAGLALIVAPLAFSQSEEDDEEEIFELSPFSVSADEQSGYRATSTLAGTRIKTSLKDVGSAIQVATKEFLEDTGATNIEELLSYTTGTEAGGASGNYAGSGAAAGNVDLNNELGRANPVGNSRVRGLSSASSTRDLFLSPSWIGFDSYNTEAVTISRGPNSVLFGIGEPGGVVDSATKKAHYGGDKNQVSIRVGSYGTYRGTLDINRVLIEDRLAVRFNGMHEHVKFRQKPAYEKDNRFQASVSAKLFKNEEVEWLGATEFEASIENAAVRGTPPDTMPMFDTYSHWWNAPGSQAAYEITGKKPVAWWEGDWNTWQENYASQWVEDTVGGTTPAGYRWRSQPSMWGAYSIVFDGATGEVDAGYDSGEYADVGVIHATSGAFINSEGLQTPGWNPLWIPHQNGPLGAYGSYGFKRQVISDKNIYDWEKMLIQGSAQYVNHNYDSFNALIRQGFWDNKAGIELAVDEQTYDNERFFPMGRHIYSSVKIDNSKYLTNGELNPNLGRPFFAGVYDPTKYYENNYKTQRLTAFIEHDFTETDGWGKWLGKHTLTGLASAWEKNDKSNNKLWSWDVSGDADQTYKPGDPAGWGGQMFFHAYIGPSNLDVSDPSGLKLYQRPMDIQVPVEGQTFTNYYFQNNGSAATNEIRTGTVTVDRWDKWPGRSKQEIDSEGLTMQSKFLGGHLVTTYGWRKDTASAWSITSKTNRETGVADNSGADLAASYDNWDNGNDETRPEGAPTHLSWAEGPMASLVESGQTTTAQAVLHVPAEWTNGLPWSPEFSVHYSESENFNPKAVQRDIYGSVLPSPSGETTEQGFSVRLAEDKVNLRFNWYETSSKGVKNTNITSSLWAFTWPKGWAERWLQKKNQYLKSLVDDNPEDTAFSFEEQGWGDPDNPNAVHYDGATGPFNSFDEAINFFLYDAMPAETVAALNPRIVLDDEGYEKIETDSIRGLTSLADIISEGFEFEATLNPTRNWRVSFNASKTESTFGNGLSELYSFTEEIAANFDQYGDQIWDMYEGGAVLVRNRWLEATNPLAAAATKEGTVSTELRKWRWNMVTNYNFHDGRMKGFGVGGSLRWQDDVSLGYPIMANEAGNFVPVLSDPFMGGQDMRGDLWFSYRTKIGAGEMPFKIQLNLQNVLGDDAPIPVAINPDGEMAIVRSAPEKKFMITTTIDF